MTNSTRNLLIAFGLLLLVLGYQVFFTDAYDGLFGSTSSSSNPTTLQAPAVETPANQAAKTSSPAPNTVSDQTGETADGAQTSDVDATDPSASQSSSSQAADSRFRSDQLLRDIPAENPFRSIVGTPSALFDPSQSGSSIPLSPNASASVLENGELADTGDVDDDLGSTIGTTVGVTVGGETSSGVPTQPGSTGATRTPQRVASAPVARLQPPTPRVGPLAPEFTPLFSTLAPAPLIRTTRQPSAVQLPTSLPDAPVASFDTPLTQVAPRISERMVAPPLAYFSDLDIYPVIAFTADNRHADPANTPRTTRIRDLQAYFNEIDLTFTGTARGSVTVGVFRSTLTLGPVVLAVGQTLPETDITLTRLTTTEAEFTLGEQTRVLTLNLRW